MRKSNSQKNNVYQRDDQFDFPNKEMIKYYTNFADAITTETDTQLSDRKHEKNQQQQHRQQFQFPEKVELRNQAKVSEQYFYFPPQGQQFQQPDQAYNNEYQQWLPQNSFYTSDHNLKQNIIKKQENDVVEFQIQRQQVIKNVENPNQNQMSMNFTDQQQYQPVQTQKNYEELKKQINYKEILSSVKQMIKNTNFTNGDPVLELKLKQNQDQNYILQQDDIYQVFSRYGQIKDLIMKNESTVFVIFYSQKDALFAVKHLNGFKIDSIGLTLEVSWYGKQPSFKQQENDKSDQDERTSNNQYSIFSEETKNHQSNQSQNHQGKYTCRYEIQIKKDKEFDAPKRIIGSRGSKMKEILERCQKAFPDIKKRDLLKLRLRGQGSGHKEGPHKQESKEPMHLCVSSKHEEVFEVAQKLVEILLKNIYEEFYLFEELKGIKQNKKLKIKLLNRRRRNERKYSKKNKNFSKNRNYQCIKKQKNHFQNTKTYKRNMQNTHKINPQARYHKNQSAFDYPQEIKSQGQTFPGFNNYSNQQRKLSNEGNHQRANQFDYNGSQ